MIATATGPHHGGPSCHQGDRPLAPTAGALAPLSPPTNQTVPIVGKRWTLIHMMAAQPDHVELVNRLQLAITAQESLMFSLAARFSPPVRVTGPLDAGCDCAGHAA